MNHQEDGTAAGVPDHDAIVIGAGFSGLYMLYRLRDVLKMRVRVFEAADGVGGTWYLNTYPGARCDSESYVYCYSFSDEVLQEWKWSRKYPEQAEILAYLNYVADKFDLKRDIQFGATVTSARWDDDTSVWRITINDGTETTARYLITALGLLASAPHTPEIRGLDDFAGERYHTGQWPRAGVDLVGKRVGVIGTGSTGVQAIPKVAEVANHLYVFQRTPQYAFPAHDGPIDPEHYRWIRSHYKDIWRRARSSIGGFPWQNNGRSALDATDEERQATFERLWGEGGFQFLWASYKDILTNPRANKFAADFVRDRIREAVENQDLAERLIPGDWPLGARRPIVESNYFSTYNRDNVSLISLEDEPIETITSRGIATRNAEYPLDVLVFATGFDAVTGPFLRIDIRGRAGLKLQAKWGLGPKTYLGIGMSEFPNFFMITGPGSMFANHPVTMEHHVEWITDCIAFMERNGIAAISATPDAETYWGEHIQAQADRTFVSQVSSWWTGTNIPGRSPQVLFYLGSYSRYREYCDVVAAKGYEGFFLEVSNAEAPLATAKTGF